MLVQPSSSKGVQHSLKLARLHITIVSVSRMFSSSAGEIPSHQPENSEDSWNTLLCDTIPQLDGSTGPPKGGKRKTRKTLKHKRRQLSLHTHRPPDKLSPMCTSDTLSDKDTAAPSSTVTGTESSDSEVAKATVSKKARPSLSLRKKLPRVSKDLTAAHGSADYTKKDLGLPSSVCSLSAHPLASRLKRQALTDCLRPHVKRLNMSQVGKGLSQVKKAVSCSDSEHLEGGAEKKQLQRRRRRRRASKHKSWKSVVPPGWSKTLRTRYIGRGGGGGGEGKGGEGRGGEDEELVLSPELIVGLEKYSYKDQLQTAIEESLMLSGGSSTKPTTSAPMRGRVSSSTGGEEFHTTSEIETEAVTSVPQTAIIEAASSESEKLDTGSMPEQSLDPERCNMSPDDLDVTVVAESPFGSPRVAVDSASMTPSRCLHPPLEHVESLARRGPAVSASSSQYNIAAEPIPKPEELESFFESAPLVDRASESVGGNAGNLDVSLAESDFQLALTASDTDTESEDAMSVSVEREGIPERHHWHLEATAMECTSAEKATGGDTCIAVSNLFL